MCLISSNLQIEYYCLKSSFAQFGFNGRSSAKISGAAQLAYEVWPQKVAKKE
jgi:hypothetical protein